MKEKIKHFSKGNFQMKKPDIVFSETNLILNIGEGEIYEGFFTVENLSDGDIRGLVYSSSFRAQCSQPGFIGNPITIEFRYDGRGLKPGYAEKGMFTVICNGGEYTINFTAIIEKPYVMSSQGKIQDLRGFKKLAYNDFEEAKKIFKSRDFYELIKYEQPKIKNLYDNMRKWNLDALGMEEFLVGIKQKEKIFLTLEAKKRVYKSLDGKLNDSVEITKNTWGYQKFKVSSNCDFIEPKVTTFTTLDFVNTQYVLQYSVMNTRLHVGKNFGDIVVETPFEKYVYAIEVDNTLGDYEDKRQEDFIKAYLLKSILRLESEQIDLKKWKFKASKLINELQALSPNSNEYKLYQAYMFIHTHEYDEAQWILENYTYSKFSIGRDVEVDAFYLFLSAKQRRETVYTKKVVEELQHLYVKNPKSWKILWMLVQVDPYYNDYYEKKHALENQFNLGANHIVLYLQAYRCFKEKPTNLKKLGNFEIQILRFAIKYKLLTKDLALYVAELAVQQKMYDKRIIEILGNSYDLFPEYIILSSLCSILIKGNETDKKYFKWYDLAVKEDVKIAKIFEYYMETVDVTMKEPLPRTVLLYFAHGSNMSYDKMSLLYANILQQESEDSILFSLYKDAIKVFTMQQLEMRRMDSNLKVLYCKYLSDDEMNIEKIKAVYDITHSYQITTKVQNMKFVLVIANDGGIYQKIPYVEGGCQVILDSKDDIIAWESMDGIYYVGSVKYQMDRLFYEKKYVEMCKRHIDQILPQSFSRKSIELNYDTLYDYGMDEFEDRKILAVCIKRLKDQEEIIEERFMTYVLYTLFQREIYEKSTLEYLVKFYVGAIRNLKELWYAAQDYEVDTSALSERIISQMLFTEMLIGEDEIFKDYYVKGAYFRVEEAYMSYVCREYLVKNKTLSKINIEMIMDQLHRKFNVADIIKIAMLKYFSMNPIEGEDRKLLKLCLQELCEKQMYFDFYMNYKKDWLREVQLWDKTLISYTSKLGGSVKLIYQLQSDNMEGAIYEEEVMTPIFETIYVKKFMVFKNEVLRYYFQETLGNNIITSEKMEYCIDEKHHAVGKYGRINAIIDNLDKRDEMMTNYALEETLASKMFVPYE